ncbi:MAG: hypothetical protein Q8P41_17900 [Pseudomonadota bacterium]|nr:hypothetical protein [Pseudomonadota bacterium]
MTVLGIIFFFIGALGVAGFFMQRHKAGRLGSTPVVSTADAANNGTKVAGEKGALAVQGKVACAAPLTSPVTHTQCMYYELTINASWKVGESKENAEILKTKEAAGVTVDDGSGPVQVVISSPSDDEFKETFKKSQSRGIMAAMSGNVLKFGDKGFHIIAGQDIPGRKIPDDAEYTVVEKTIPVIGQAYVSGKSDGGTVIAPNWVSLTISTKSKEELLAGTATMMQRTKYVAIGGGSLGAVFSLLGLIMGSGDAPVAPAAPPVTQGASAPALGAPADAPPAPAADAPAADAPAADAPAANP